jgi:hypothetical protein
MSNVLDHRDDEANNLALIATYGDLLSRYGVDSEEARAFRTAEPGREKLLEDLTKAAERLKRSAKKQDADARAQEEYLQAQLTAKRWLTRVIGLLLIAGALISLVVLYLTEHQKTIAQKQKNLQILEFTNLAIQPFVYYKIPMSQHAHQNLSIYEGIERLAKRLPPESNRDVWSRELRYAWARSALVYWQNVTNQAERDAWYETLTQRIQHIKAIDPDYARIYSLEAQAKTGLARRLKGAGAKADAKRHYETAIELNRIAIEKEKENDSTLAYNNLAYGLYQLGQLEDDRTAKIQHFEEGCKAAETAVRLARPLFILGHESAFATYLESLGDIYEPLISLYGESNRLDDQKALVAKALPVYTDILWNYYDVDFGDLDSDRTYTKYNERNGERLKSLRKLAHDLNVPDVTLKSP